METLAFVCHSRREAAFATVLLVPYTTVNGLRLAHLNLQTSRDRVSGDLHAEDVVTEDEILGVLARPKPMGGYSTS